MNYRIIDQLIRQFPYRLRKPFYKLFGMKVGAGTAIGRGCVIDNPSKLIIGKNNDFNFNCEFHLGEYGDAKIIIGDRNWFACSVKLITITHEIGERSQRAGKSIFEPITIGDGNWIGANVMILPGIKIEDGCVIAAGAVVTSDCKSNGMYAGIPAKLIKELE